MAVTTMECGAHRANVLLRLELPDVEVVSCHAFTADGQLLAISPNNEDILVFRVVEGEFQRVGLLQKHTQRVTGLSWSSQGRLASCSEDRTAWVWEHDGKDWRAVDVEIRSKYAALCVSWAPNGARLAVGTAARDTMVCYYEPQVSSWVGVRVGKSKASVVAVTWHHSSQYLASGSTDRRCTVYNVDETAMLPEKRAPFGEVQMLDDVGAWINDVLFSATGRFVACLVQDATVRIKDMSQGPQAAMSVVRSRHLPFRQGAWIGDRHLVACGYDFVPVLIIRNEGQWQMAGRLDAGPPAAMGDGGARKGAMRQSFDAARSAFRGSAAGLSKSGTIDEKAESQGPPSWHTNTITCCSSLQGTRFATSGLDGQVLVWELET